MDSVKTNIARVEGLPNIVQLSPYKKVPDYYKVLGVDHSASDETIKKTYKALVLKIHPDKISDDDLKDRANQAFVKVQDAYETLTDTNKRASYNATSYMRNMISKTPSNPSHGQKQRQASATPETSRTATSTASGGASASTANPPRAEDQRERQRRQAEQDRKEAERRRQADEDQRQYFQDIECAQHRMQEEVIRRAYAEHRRKIVERQQQIRAGSSTSPGVSRAFNAGNRNNSPQTQTSQTQTSGWQPNVDAARQATRRGPRRGDRSKRSDGRAQAAQVQPW